jgi:hypothetical protein
LIKEATFAGQVLLIGGPYVDFGEGPLISNWLLRSCEAVARDGTLTILTTGEGRRSDGAEPVPVVFEIEIDGRGLITTRYRIEDDGGGKNKIGLAYLLPATVDRLAWHRKALWSAYPEDHIGRPKGVALKLNEGQALIYREKPARPWAEDVGDFFLFGKKNTCPQASNDFRSLKENVWYASCLLAGSEIRARAEGAGDLAARATVLPNGEVTFSLYNHWPYPDLAWGNYTGNVAPALTSREVRLRLTDLPEEQ